MQTEHTRRPLLAAILLALGAAGCAHKVPAPVNAAADAAQAVANAAAQPAEALPAPAPVVEQYALDRLKAMSQKLAAAEAFTYRSRSTVELPAKTGQFLTHFVESSTALQRPNKLRTLVTGDVPNFQLYYDGATVAAYDAQKNLYATTKAPATLDETLTFVMDKLDIDFPSADFMFSDPYAVMTKGMTHAIAVGDSKVNGVATEHFAFMGPESNWEIWIDNGASALP
ncbi:MAG: DUF2092 domain-containing protein, partial [Candidatus Methylumidiphilus sp.]